MKLELNWEKYKKFWKSKSLWWRLKNNLWWRCSYIWAAFFGGPCQAEKLLMLAWKTQVEELKGLSQTSESDNNV